MFAVLSTAWVLPGVIGPAIAGTVGEVAGWRYVFLGLLPLIALAAALTLGALRNVADAPPVADETARARRGRLPLAITVALGAGLLTVGLTSGEPIPTVVLSVVGILIGLFALRKLTPPGTLVARPVLAAAVLLRGILTCMFFGVDAFVALTLVGWRGVLATEAGIALTSATIAWTAGAWIQARGATRWPTWRFVQAGFLVTLIGLAGMIVVLDPDVTWLFAILAFGVAGLGMGLAYSPLALIVLREATADAQGAATSALSLSDSLGTALGTGITGAIVAASLRATGNPAAGLAVGVRGRARDRARRTGPDRPAPTAQPRPPGPMRPVARVAARRDGRDACGRLRTLSRLPSGAAADRPRGGPDHRVCRGAAREDSRGPRLHEARGSSSTTSRRC